jgi:hypothetical protein
MGEISMRTFVSSAMLSVLLAVPATADESNPRTAEPTRLTASQLDQIKAGERVIEGPGLFMTVPDDAVIWVDGKRVPQDQKRVEVEEGSQVRVQSQGQLPEGLSISSSSLNLGLDFDW